MFWLLVNESGYCLWLGIGMTSFSTFLISYLAVELREELGYNIFDDYVINPT